MREKLRILVVEDLVSDVDILKHELKKNGIQFTDQVVETEEAYILSLKSFFPEIILSDYTLPRFDGMMALKIRNELSPSIPFILVTGSTNEEIAVECMKAGADDYLIKDNLTRLSHAIHAALEKKAVIRVKEEAEKALRASEERLQSIFRVAPTGIGVVKDRIFLEVNERVCEMTGYTREELIGKSARLIYPSLEEFDFVGREKYRQIAEKNTGTIETRWLRKDGGIIHILLASTPILPEDLSLGITFTALDITERKRVEEQLRISDKIFNYAFDMLCLAGFDGYFKTLNPSWSRVLGWSTEELLAKPWIEFVHPEDRVTTTNARSMLIDGRDVVQFMNRYKCKDGSFKWLSWNSFPSPEEKLIFGVARDITESKVIEDELKESEELFRSFFEKSPIGIEIYDYRGIQLAANQASNEMFGIADESSSGFNLFEGTSLNEDLKKKLRQGETIGYSAFFDFDKVKELNQYKTTRSGKAQMEYIITPLKSADKESIHGYLLIVQDITDRKQAEKELYVAMEKAQESDRLKSAFLSNMSHEIRTPMNAILGFSELLGQPDSLPEEQERFTGIIRNAGKRLMHIIDDIIDISKLEAKQIKITRSACNVSQLLNSTLVSFRNMEILTRKPALRLVLDLPDTSAIAEVETDPVRLQQVLDNLITNAIKYSTEGDIEAGVRRVVQNGSNHLEFFVKDCGKGIPPDKLSIIFERFRQVEENEYHEGAGLGLSISRALVELLGGELKVQSEVGKGTTFTFTIPDVPVLNEKKLPIVTPADKSFDLSGKTILVAEDDDDSYFFISLLMSETNATVLRAENGVILMEMVREKVPDLLLLDINMPGKTGYECMREIREKGYRVKVIAQTAYAMADEKRRCMEAGCDGYLAKPFTKKGLFDSIDAVF